jgi:hypothetical protein
MFTTSASCPAAAPTVTVMTPPDGICPETAIVSAAFVLPLYQAWANEAWPRN